ncbi:MAG: aminoglycoside phosphotransferase family protein [Chloroflexota bacterium]|nr:aminoglycoside phosphotransferase family protein [Chloroflexota bacterium]
MILNGFDTDGHHISGMPDWLRMVAAARAAGADVWTERDVTVRHVTGGANNALYRIETDGRYFACKLCVADERRRTAREYGALRLLQAAGLDVAPRPLWLDESRTIVPFPAVVYRWLIGEHLSPSPAAQQLAALLESYHRIHTLRQCDHDSFGLPDAWFHWFDFAPYLVELDSFLAEYGAWLATTEPDGQYLRDRLAQLVDGCAQALTTASVDPGRECVPLCLCRVDPNLANGVWGQDSRLRWVDWEYSGWGDPALDLAELRWHAALAELSAPQQAWLRENYRRPAGDPGFGERLVVWDRLLATRWPFLILRWLWSEHHGSDRVRLTHPTYDKVEMRARLVRFIKRAEDFAASRE